MPEPPRKRGGFFVARQGAASPVRRPGSSTIARGAGEPQSAGVTRRALSLLALLLGPIAATAAAPTTPEATLRMAVNEANGRPYALYDARGAFAGGIARDIIEPLAGALGLRTEYL